MVGPQSVEFDYGKVHALSLDIMTQMEDSEVPVNLGVVASAMTLGRLMNPEGYPIEKEEAFIEAVIQWAGLYFMEGVPN